MQFSGTFESSHWRNVEGFKVLREHEEKRSSTPATRERPIIGEGEVDTSSYTPGRNSSLFLCLISH